jgi:redox-sensitive bicupin YhaK (pirin superfamily)
LPYAARYRTAGGTWLVRSSFDQMGPVQFVAGHGPDVRPHPHIGLATVTYLFDGRVMHRNS